MPASPAQPALPSVALQGAAAILPQLNSTYFPGTGMTTLGAPGTMPPQIPQPTYAELAAIMSRHPTNQNRGNTGFQENQLIQFPGTQNSLLGTVVNGFANMGFERIMDRIMPGAGEAMRLMPMQGVEGMSRFDFYRGRQRQLVSEQLMTGDRSIMASNPDLAFFDPAGIARNPLFQGVVGMNGYKSAFQTTFGQFGTAFGGNVFEQGLGAGRALVGVSSGLRDSSGMGFNRAAMQGLGIDEIMSGMGAARNMGAFGITNQRIRELANDVASAGQLRKDGDIAGAERLESRVRQRGGRMGSQIADVMAAGRDVFGQDKNAYEIFGQIEQTLGKEGMADAGSAANRLRQIDAAAQTLNTDAQSVAKYMQVMKQMAANVGIVGEAGTSAALRSMMTTEGSVRRADRLGIGTDPSTVTQDRESMVQRNLGSVRAHEKGATTNVFAERAARGELVGMELNVNGQRMSAMDVNARIQEGNRRRRDGQMSTEEMAAFEKFVAGARTALSQSGDPYAKQMSQEIAQRTRRWDNDLESSSASAVGATSYAEGVQGGGVGENVLNRLKKTTASVAQLEHMSEAQANQALRAIGQAGGFSAIQGKKNLVDFLMQDRVDPATGATVKGLDEATARRTASFANRFTQQYAIGSNDSGANARKALAAWEQAEFGRGDRAEVNRQNEENRVSREVFGRVLGGTFGGNHSLTTMLFDVGRQVMREGAMNATQKTSLREAITKALPAGTGADSVNAILGLFSGEGGYTENGKQHTLVTLGKELKDLDAQGGTEAQKAERRKNAMTGFLQKAMAGNTHLRDNLVTADAAPTDGKPMGAFERTLEAYNQAQQAQPGTTGAAGGGGGGPAGGQNEIVKVLNEIKALGATLVDNLLKALGVAPAGGTTQNPATVPGGIGAGTP